MPGVRPTPVQVQNLSGVTAVAGGGGYSLALKFDGTVWACGFNAHGQLGDGTNNPSTTPVQVLNLSGVTAIAARSDFSLALRSDGTVWAWGRNSIGELGDGTTIDRPTPVQVLNLSGITAISAGEGHGLALKSDGTVWAWGLNLAGQLGDGTAPMDHRTPVQVSNLSGITAINSGDDHSLALKNDGTVWAWGYNEYGQLGDGTAHNSRPTPVQVLQNLSGVTAVAGGGSHSLALKFDGTVWAWGYNFQGELGDGSADIFRPTPMQVPNLSGVKAIVGGSGHSLALRTDGTIQAWGWNIAGQLGDGTWDNERHTPVQVLNLSGITAVGAGIQHSLAVGPPLTLLTVRKILEHPDPNHFRRFNIMIDGVMVAADINAGDTTQRVSPGIHTVSEAGGTDTPLGDFTIVIGGDCAADGTVTLALGDNKTCTITNYDNMGGGMPQILLK
jgi:alpha-tubulin suppressor-like RCC1 family protein